MSIVALVSGKFRDIQTKNFLITDSIVFFSVDLCIT